MNMPVSHSTIAEAGIHCKMDVEYLVRENGVIGGGAGVYFSFVVGPQVYGSSNQDTTRGAVGLLIVFILQ